MTYGAPTGGWPQFNKKETDVVEPLDDGVHVSILVEVEFYAGNEDLDAERSALIGFLEGAGYEATILTARVRRT
jgi:hypothetical protein